MLPFSINAPECSGAAVFDHHLHQERGTDAELFRNKQQAHEWNQYLKKASVREERNLRLIKEGAEEVTILDPDYKAPVIPEVGALGLEEQLDWALDNSTGIGEEILADFMALTLTGGLLGDRLLPVNECLSACVMAMRELSVLRFAGLVCRRYPISGPPMDVLAEFIQEQHTRRRFIGISAQLLSHKQDLREVDFSLETNEFDKVLEDRSMEFVTQLRDFGHIWDVKVEPELCAMDPKETLQSLDRVSDNEDFISWVRSVLLPGIIAHQTRIGPRLTDDELREV